MTLLSLVEKQIKLARMFWILSQFVLFWQSCLCTGHYKIMSLWRLVAVNIRKPSIWKLFHKQKIVVRNYQQKQILTTSSGEITWRMIQVLYVTYKLYFQSDLVKTHLFYISSFKTYFAPYYIYLYVRTIYNISNLVEILLLILFAAIENFSDILDAAIKRQIFLKLFLCIWK